jgi:Leucine-rich repeat (LRR) protein
VRKPVLLAVLALIPMSFVRAQVPTAERDALIAFYNSTNGASWDTGSWPPSCTEWLGDPGTECSWCGVTCVGGHVESLSAGDSNLYGPLPPELENLTNLKYLYVRFSKLNGSLPTWLGNLTNLKYLLLDSNWLTGSIPPELSNLSNLTWLKLNDNLLDGTIPPELGDLPALQSLELGYNDLSGSIPPELGNVSTMTSLYLQYNYLTGSIPPELGSLPLSFGLRLDGNQLTGSIPAELGNLPNLQQLWLDGNELSGKIPPELGNNTSLTYLILSRNRLTGSIPPELENLTSLQRLWLDDNRLTGAIPAELQNLANLTWLDLSDNLLSATIPPELANLTALGYLQLDSNRLTGGIPEELGDMPVLKRLHMHANRLNGEIPTNLENLTTTFIKSGFDLRWNALHSDDATLLSFINSRQVGGDCLDTQTIAPENPSFSRVGDHTVWLSWDAVAYQADSGGYEVFSSPTGTGVWTSRGWNEAKTTTTFPVAGLDPGTTYDLAVVSYTNPHADNLNFVNSDLSTQVMTSTASTGCAQPVIDVAGAGMGPFTLSLTESYDSYSWNTGETTSNIEANPPYGQWYWVTVTSSGPCEETAAILVDPEVFVDGFEEGDTADWSSSVP